MQFKDIIIVLGTSLVLLLAAEFISMQILEKDGNDKDFFYQEVNALDIEKGGSFYNVVDPLLGWANDYVGDNNNNFQSRNNAFIFENYTPKCSADTLVIYISGGSTCDLSFNAENWPVYLFDLLKENGYCVKLYVSAVAGYNSGQEFLKLIRDLSKINPDIHISYSGANEVENFGFVSYYEFSLLNHFINNNTSSLLPNLITLLKESLLNNKYDLMLLNVEESSSIEFWANNMKSMNSIAEGRNYTFISFLQPVIGFAGNPKRTVSEDEPYFHLLAGYNEFYPKARVVAEKEAYIHDFTSVFEGVNEEVFIDDCHLKDRKFQKIIAEKVFDNLLLEIEKSDTL